MAYDYGIDQQIQSEEDRKKKERFDHLRGIYGKAEAFEPRPLDASTPLKEMELEVMQQKANPPVPVSDGGEREKRFNYLKNVFDGKDPAPKPQERIQLSQDPAPKEEKEFSYMDEYLVNPVMRFGSSYALNVPDFIPGYAESSEATTPSGAVVNGIAELAGFIVGAPMKIGAKVGGAMLKKFAPKLSSQVAQQLGIKGLSQSMAHGGASLGIASGVSDIAPAIQEHGFAPETVMQVAQTTAMMSVIGGLFPGLGVVKSKPLRVATGLATMDALRGLVGGSGLSTVDDVYKAYQSGEIDNKQLTESVFGYVLDMYFSVKTPRLSKQFEGFKNIRAGQDKKAIHEDLVAWRDDFVKSANEQDIGGLIKQLSPMLEKGRASELYTEAVERAKTPQLLLAPRGTIQTPAPNKPTTEGLLPTKNFGVDRPFEHPSVETPLENRMEYKTPEEVKVFEMQENHSIDKAEKLLSELDSKPQELRRETLTEQIGDRLPVRGEKVTEPVIEAPKQEQPLAERLYQEFIFRPSKIDAKISELDELQHAGVLSEITNRKAENIEKIARLRIDGHHNNAIEKQVADLVKLETKLKSVQPKPVEESGDVKMRYGLKARPLEAGMVPEGRNGSELGDGTAEQKHGVVTYDRVLTQTEIDKFELVPLEKKAPTVKESLSVAKPVTKVKDLKSGDVFQFTSKNGEISSYEITGFGKKPTPIVKIKSATGRGQFSKVKFQEFMDSGEINNIKSSKPTKPTEPKQQTQKELKESTLQKIDMKIQEMENKLDVKGGLSEKENTTYERLYDAKTEIESLSMGQEFANAVSEAVKGLGTLLGDAKSERGSLSGKEWGDYGKFKNHFDASLKSFQRFGKGVNDVFSLYFRTFGNKIAKHLLKWKKDLLSTFDLENEKYKSGDMSNAERLVYSKKAGEAGNKARNDYDKIQAIFDSGRAQVADLKKGSYQKTKDFLAEKIVETSPQIRKRLNKAGSLGKKAMRELDLLRGAGAQSRYKYKKVWKDISGDLTKAERTMLADLIQARRTIVINENKGDEFKFTDGSKAKQYENWENEFQSRNDIPQERMDALNDARKKYFDFFKAELDLKLEKGLVTQEAYDTLIEQGDYSPRKILDYIDPHKEYQSFISVGESGVKKLSEEGSMKYLESNPEVLLKEVITRNTAIIKKNEANQNLYNLSVENPNNGVVKPVPYEGTNKSTGAPKYGKADLGYEKISVLVDGMKKEMQLPKELAEQWKSSATEISYDLGNVAGWLSGKNVLQFFATGAGNPLYGLVNLIRDPQHIYMTTNMFSPILPKFAGQFSKRVSEVSKDAITKKGEYADAMEEGMGMDFLTSQGKIFKDNATMDFLQDFITKGNEFSEIVSRLAIRRQVILNKAKELNLTYEEAYKDVDLRKEATWEARNYIDFNQGGSYTKAMGTVVPYLNAGVQATRGLVRSAKADPKTFMGKTSQLALLSAGLYLANSSEHSEEFDKVNEYDRINNFIIMTGEKYTDKDGNERMYYAKIPKDQGQKAIGTIVEGALDKMQGKEFNVDRVVQSAKELIAFLPTSMIPPTVDAMLGYFANYDFWRNKNIWNLGDVNPEDEAYLTTSPALKKVGEKTGMSPERLGYVFSKLFTSSGLFTSAVGGGMNSLTKAIDPKLATQLQEDRATKLRKDPVRKKFLGITRASDDVTEERQMKLDQASESFKQNQVLEMMLIQHFEEGKDTSERIGKYIQDQKPIDRDRLIQRVKNFSKTVGLKNRSWWMVLADNRPDVRAKIFYSKFATASDEEQKELLETAHRLTFVGSKEFIKQLKLILIKEKLNR